jgi:hypothetical protein
MGLYFNTRTTRDMQSKVNEQFTGSNIDFWKDFDRKKDFRKQSEGGKPLHAIAFQNVIVPDDGPDSDAGKRWKQWLKDLEKITGDQMRDIFFKHLNQKCIELSFVALLNQSMPITIVEGNPVVVGSDGRYHVTIEIYTPTARVVRAALKKRLAAIAKRRAARKKKT